MSLYREDRCGFLDEDGTWWDIRELSAEDTSLCEENGCDLTAMFEAQAVDEGDGGGYRALCCRHMIGWSGLDLADDLEVPDEVS